MNISFIKDINIAGAFARPNRSTQNTKFSYMILRAVRVHILCSIEFDGILA